jgi:hypothetical protein
MTNSSVVEGTEVMKGRTASKRTSLGSMACSFVAFHTYQDAPDAWAVTARSNFLSLNSA